jgi:phage baseplate assembly protein W
MPTPTKNRTYQGYSTVVGDGLTTLYDAALVTQDLNNAFNTKKGEVMTDPTYGSIAWDMLFEPATQDNFNIIQNDCMVIFNNEPRVQVQSITVTGSNNATNPGFIMQAQLLYIGINVSGTFTMNFFQNLANNDPGT